MPTLDLGEAPPFLEILAQPTFTPAEACKLLSIRRGYLAYLARWNFLEVEREPYGSAKGAFIARVTAPALARFMTAAYRIDPGARFARLNVNPPPLLSPYAITLGIAVKPMYSRAEVANILRLRPYQVQSLVTHGFLPAVVAPRGTQNQVLCVLASDLAAFLTALDSTLGQRLEAEALPQRDGYSLAEVVRVLEVNPSTVARFRNAGRLRPMESIQDRGGAEVLISVESLQRTLEENTVRRMCLEAEQ